MHDNEQAIALYEKLGFQRVPVFCVKRKNPINEPLFMREAHPRRSSTPTPASSSARPAAAASPSRCSTPRRGFFALTFGGRTIVCRESLSELTTAVAMSRCDDKRVTRRVLLKAGLRVPAQRVAGRASRERRASSAQHGRVVVKPARGEQGAGVSVDIRTAEELQRPWKRPGACSDDVLLEELVEGEDLRIIVIDYQVVAAAVRRPPQVTGTGEHTSGV